MDRARCCLAFVALAACDLSTSRQGPDENGGPDSGSDKTLITVNPERFINTPIAATTGHNATDASVAFDGTNYLVVWADARDRFPDMDIWGVRITQDGSILDPVGIQIAAMPGAQLRPQVVFDGARYVVVWEDYKTLDGVEADLAAATVSNSGAVTMLPPVATSAASETSPAIASNGNGALVTWIADSELMAASFDGSFGTPFVVASGANPIREPAIGAAAGGNYLVAFTEATATRGEDTRAQIVSPSGTLVGTTFDVSNGGVDTRAPSVSFDGSNFVVVWSSYWLGVDIYGTRITPAGAVLDTHLENGVSVGGSLIHYGFNYQETPTVACRATGCLVSWQDKRNLASTGFDIYGQLMAPDFSLVGSDFAISTAPLSQLQPRVIPSSDGFFEIWRDARAGANAALRIMATPISATGTVSAPDGIVINRGYNSQQAPALARNGGQLALTWKDSVSLIGDDIVFVRMDAMGDPLDTSPSIVSDAPYAQVEVSGIALGPYYLFAWSDNRSGRDPELYIRRVEAATGVGPDGSGIQVASAMGGRHVTPQLAASPTDALLVWKYVSPTGDEQILGAVVDANGVASSPFVICAAGGGRARPVAVYDSTAGHYVVMWMDERTGNSDIYAARVASSGTVLDPDGALIASGASGNSLVPQIASKDGIVLLVYQDDRNGNWDIYARRVAATDLSLPDASDIAITTDAAHQYTPAVTTFGSRFLIVWTDECAMQTAHQDLYGQLVTTTASFDGDPFLIAGGIEAETSPALIDIGNGTALVAYTVHRGMFHAKRVATRLLSVVLTY